eukprot:8661835-Lingulodinium_polyedra.AAC.1
MSRPLHTNHCTHNNAPGGDEFKVLPQSLVKLNVFFNAVNNVIASLGAPFGKVNALPMRTTRTWASIAQHVPRTTQQTGDTFRDATLGEVIFLGNVNHFRAAGHGA